MIAVIDIGSNSVRLVIYDQNGAALQDKKVYAELGRQWREADKLYPPGKKKALDALLDFRNILNALSCNQVLAIGTAALRDRLDGAKFTRKLEQKSGFRIDVISWEEEAALSAEGVRFGIPGAKGVVLDMGGNSLEFSYVTETEVQPIISLMLGHLYLRRYEETLDAYIASQLKELRIESGKPVDTLYLSGGAWRAFIKAFKKEIRNSDVSGTLHGTSLTRDEVLQFCDFVRPLDSKMLRKLVDDKGRRKVLPLIGVMLSALLKKMPHTETIVFSETGLREGLLYRALNSAD